MMCSGYSVRYLNYIECVLYSPGTLFHVHSQAVVIPYVDVLTAHFMLLAEVSLQFCNAMLLMMMTTFTTFRKFHTDTFLHFA